MTAVEGAPGRLVQVGNRQIRVLTSDGPGPAVVFDAGAGGPLDSWWRVLEQLRGHVAWVAYDRPGLGGSQATDADDDKRPATIAATLAALLDELGETEPVILVGHSRGGLHIRAFASLYPLRTAGLIQVDPSHDRMLDSMAHLSSPIEHAVGKVFASVFTLLDKASMLGTPRLLAPLLASKKLTETLALAPTHAAAMRRAMTSRASLHATRLESTRLEPSLEQMSDLPLPPGIPVTVLSGDQMNDKRTKQPLRDALNALHAELAASAGGTHTVVPHCGHMVPITHPDAVVTAVLDLHGRITRK